MKQIQYKKFGGPQEMYLADAPKPMPKANEVLIKVHAAAINPVDWRIREGRLPLMTGRRFPRAMGMEFSGVVESVGKKVRTFKVGQSVFGSTGLKTGGAHAEYVCTAEHMLAHKPAALSFEQASAISVAPVAAWRGLMDKAELKQGETVLIMGCAGAVGRAAVEIAKKRGAKVFGTCHPSDTEEMIELGVEQCFDYALPLPDQFKGQLDVLFDTAGLFEPEEAYVFLKPKTGTFLDMNFTARKLFKGLFTDQYKAVMATPSRPLYNEIASMVSKGEIKVAVGDVVTLDHAIEAIGRLQAATRRKGKTIIRFDQGDKAQ